jgi:hypothetical protein
MTPKQIKEAHSLLNQQRNLEEAICKPMIDLVAPSTDWHFGSANEFSRAEMVGAASSIMAGAESMMKARANQLIKEISERLEVLGVTDDNS